MKILIWTDGFWPRIGGIETQVLEFVQALQGRGHTCHVIAQKDTKEQPEFEVYNSIPIRRSDFNRAIFHKELIHLKSLYSYLETLAQEFRPDILHLYSSMALSSFAFTLFRNLFKAPVILTIHAPFIDEKKGNPLLHRIASLADEICCVSNWTLVNTKPLLPPSKSKMRLIYNGLKDPNLAPTPLPFSPPTLLLLGRFSPEKGFDTAIRAFALLKTGKLLIGGAGVEENSLRKLVAELNLKNSVKFLGQLTKEESFAAINLSTMVLIPSYYESFGLVALEAMQIGRPVIASCVGGLIELIEEGKTGLLVPPNDPEALFKAINRLLKNKEEAILFGENGRKRAQFFSLDKNVDAYEGIYRGVGH